MEQSYNYSMTEQEKKDRKRVWEGMSEPKPSWEVYKRMLSTFCDVDKLRKAWLKKNGTLI